MTAEDNTINFEDLQHQVLNPSSYDVSTSILVTGYCGPALAAGYN